MSDQEISGVKDGIAGVPHTRFVFQLVNQGQVLKSSNDAHELIEPLGLHNAIDGTGLVADTNNHGFPPECRIGVFRDGGKHFFVYGERAYALEDLRVHGFLSGCDVAEIGYVLKYLRSALGLTSKATAS